ncbi:MAG: GNAT family N-acetyltransferase [Eubacteriales bacterium]|nr:GNAT family N-acetyltransferase [Eubacteriales bacterium]
MEPVFETERLLFREMEQSDFSDLADMLQDPLVMYAYEHDFSDEDVQAWLDRQRKRYLELGFGLWAMVLKETGCMIGQAGLTMQPYKGAKVLEIGYLLKHAYWHMGYAAEAAAGCKQYAFTKLRANKVHSVIKADNFASMRVAESIGMTKEDEFITQYYNGDMLHFLFSVTRQP